MNENETEINIRRHDQMGVLNHLTRNLRIVSCDGDFLLVRREQLCAVSELFREIYRDIPHCSDTLVLVPDTRLQTLSAIFSVLEAGEARAGGRGQCLEIVRAAAELGIALTNYSVTGGDSCDSLYGREEAGEKLVRLRIKKENWSPEDSNEQFCSSKKDDKDDLPEVDIMDVGDHEDDYLVEEDAETFECKVEDLENDSEIETEENDGFDPVNEIYQTVSHHYENQNGVFQCLKCKFRAENEAKIVTHIGIKHNALSIKLKNKELRCILCERIFRVKGALDSHIRKVHEGNHFFDSLKCDFCDHVCYSKGALSSHLHKFHGEKKKGFKCNVCEKVFTAKTTLDRHMDTIHLGNRVHCKQCDYTAVNESILKLHVETKHLGIRHECKLCSKDFSTSFYLKNHMEHIHSSPYKSENKLHICPICNQKFESRVSCKKHLREHNPETEEERAIRKAKERVSCDQCNRTFSCVGSLNIHIRSIHEDKKVNCPQCDWRGIKSNLKVHQSRKHGQMQLS